jgi:hypothetical protein
MDNACLLKIVQCTYACTVQVAGLPSLLFAYVMCEKFSFALEGVHHDGGAA